ncbi:MAG: hypothetical protein ACR2PZ_13870 [Pseudomonadales bacterium]
MNWEIVGSTGEWVGAFAVVVTLFYLAKQIRQNSASLDRANDYAQAGSVHSINSLYIQVFAPLSQNTELAGIYKKALEGIELNQVEAVQFGAFVNTFLAWLENMYFQHRHELGFASESLDSVEMTTGPYVHSLLNTDAGLNWWKSEGLHLYTADFVEIVENIRSKTY